MELPKRHIHKNAFFKSEFSYCPAIWMFHSRTLNNKINRLRERCLRIIYNDKLSNFEEILHHNNVVNGLSPEIMNGVFKQRSNSHYNLRHTLNFL